MAALPCTLTPFPRTQQPAPTDLELPRIRSPALPPIPTHIAPLTAAPASSHAFVRMLCPPALRWLQVSATASLPASSKSPASHGNLPPLAGFLGGTRVALSTPLRARFPSDFRRDLLRGCLVEQALTCTTNTCMAPLRVQLDVTSDDGGVLPAAIHAAALARINLGNVPREWPGFSAVSLAGLGPPLSA